MKKFVIVFSLCSLVLVLLYGFVKGRARDLDKSGNINVRIEKINYKGWKDSYKLSNGIVEVIIVPQIARIMSYSLKGEKNIFWENPALFGKASNLKKKEWQNYGGYKLWPAPQKAWGWPPDPVLDRGESEVRILDKSSIRLIGMKSIESGIRFIRDIKIFNNHIKIVQTMENISDKDVEWGIWDVTQLKPKGKVIFPVPYSGRYWDGDDGNTLKQNQWTKKDGMMYLRPSGKRGKVFAMGESGWIAYELGGLVYIKRFNPHYKEEFPEGEANTEVFTSKDYIEVEVMSPLKKLAPGGKSSFTEYWYLYKSDSELSTDEQLRNFIEEKIKQIPIPD